MRIITRKRLRAFAQENPDAAESLKKWYQLFRKANWESLQDVRRIYPHADTVIVGSGNAVTVFNICGNKFRLIVAIHFNRKRVYVLLLLRHAEYTKGFWKKQL
jgi:mRNA interferase HigB